MKNLCFAAILAGFLLFVAGCGDNENENENENPICNYPLVPSNISASTQSSNSIELQWLSSNGANNYYVYRATIANGAYSRINNTTSTSFTDVDLSPSTTYYYKITGVNDCGESEMSSYVSAVTETACPELPAPSYATAAANGNDVHIAWGKVDGAIGYGILRVSNIYTPDATPYANGAWMKPIDVVLSSTTTYIDNVPDLFMGFYVIAAYNSCAESGKLKTTNVVNNVGIY